MPRLKRINLPHYYESSQPVVPSCLIQASVYHVHQFYRLVFHKLNGMEVKVKCNNPEEQRFQAGLFCSESGEKNFIKPSIKNPSSLTFSRNYEIIIIEKRKGMMGIECLKLMAAALIVIRNSIDFHFSFQFA